MTKMERRSSILPPPAPYPGSPLCLQNKVCLGHWSPSADGDRLQWYSLFFCTDRWCTSPLSRSPAADRRILTSPVPASPTNPMRRLILSPSPLTQSEYNSLSFIPAAVRHYLALMQQSDVIWLHRFFLFFNLFTALNEELKLTLEKRKTSQDWHEEDLPMSFQTSFSMFSSGAFLVEDKSLQSLFFLLWLEGIKKNNNNSVS